MSESFTKSHIYPEPGTRAPLAGLPPSARAEMRAAALGLRKAAMEIERVKHAVAYAQSTGFDHAHPGLYISERNEAVARATLSVVENCARMLEGMLDITTNEGIG